MGKKASIFKNRSRPVGVECSTDMLRIVQLEQAGGGSVRTAARIDAEMSRGDVDMPALRRAVRKLSGRRCVVCPPRDSITVRPARLPRLTEAEFREAVRWEAAEMLDCKADEILTEPLVVSRDCDEDGRLDVLIVSTPLDVIERTLEPLLSAGLLPVAVEPSFLAAGRAYSVRSRRQSDVQVVRAVVEVGPDVSSMVVMSGDHAVFAKTIDVGGEDFNRAVSDRLSIEPQTAAALRHDAVAGRVDSSLARPLQDAMRRVADELAGEIAMSLRYVAVAARLGAVSMLHLCGEESSAPGLAEAVGTLCRGMTVTSEKTVDDRYAEACAIGGGHGPEWAVPLGLALRPVSGPQQPRRVAA